MRRVVRISDVTEYLAERHCGLMLAARMTLPHFSAGDAPAPRDGRASLRHAQDADGRDALSDEAYAQGCHRDGLARARLQSHAGHEYCRREAAHCGGPGVSGGGIAVRMLSAHQIAHSGPGKPSVDSRRAIAKHAKLSPSRRSCVDHRGPHPAENSFHTTKTRTGHEAPLFVAMQPPDAPRAAILSCDP